MNPRFALALASALAVAGAVHGQGTAADYIRANSLRQRVTGLVSHASVKPHWLPGNRFWYKSDLPGGKWEFVMVDPSVPAKRPAFDHARLAASLKPILDEPVTADRLPVEDIHIGNTPNAITIQVRGVAYDIDPQSYGLRKSGGAFGDARPLNPAFAPDSSPTSAEETNLTFANRSNADVALFWLDTDGKRTPYGTILPGQERTQHTFVGHVWLVTKPDGSPIVTFVADSTANIAAITGTTPKAPDRPADSAPESPDKQFRAAIRDNNIFLKHLDTGEEKALTLDGTPDDAYSLPVYWSPDSRRLVALKTVAAQKHPVYFVESSPSDRLEPRLHENDYLKPGDVIAHPRPHLFDVAAGKEIPVKDDLFPNPWEISEMRWDPSGRRFTFLYNQRGHQLMRLIAVDANSGRAATVIDERAKTFIDWTNKVYLHHVDGAQQAIWMSERDGWNHLYLYDTAKGSVIGRITKGSWVVRDVVRVDDAARRIWFHAGGIVPSQDPYYVHLCRVNFDGTGLVTLTEGDGNHNAVFSPDNEYLIDTYSRVDLPPVSVLRRAEDGVKVLDLERGDASALLSTGWKYPIRFAAPGRDGETPIYGILTLPSNFNPRRKYPVLEEIYAGPQGSFVPKQFNASASSRTLAELGFVVVQIDGMGTNNRSKAFQDVCWKNLADAGFPDRIAWMKAAAKQYPWLDLTRVGLYGTSAGGQSALGGLLLHGDFYKAGVADCGCHDNRMDKIWWNEQWMGWPVGPEYAANSNVNLAPRLTGKLLLMVGEMDTNVDPASTMQVVNALIKADKDFELLVVPGAGHGVSGSPYGRRRLQDFFVRNLMGVQPRRP
ncbi:MAG TPA: DPP IV N-terminal domain-containing protein [Armatimonadota bacterium]|jgi:dipeptidyl aminopeptidase/acylaminoacyl peptidase